MTTIRPVSLSFLPCWLSRSKKWKRKITERVIGFLNMTLRNPFLTVKEILWFFAPYSCYNRMRVSFDYFLSKILWEREKIISNILSITSNLIFCCHIYDIQAYLHTISYMYKQTKKSNHKDCKKWVKFHLFSSNIKKHHLSEEFFMFHISIPVYHISLLSTTKNSHLKRLEMEYEERKWA